MLDTFLEHPFFLNRYRQAPLLKERDRSSTTCSNKVPVARRCGISPRVATSSASSEAEPNARCVAGGNPASGGLLGAPAAHESKGAFLRQLGFILYICG